MSFGDPDVCCSACSTANTGDERACIECGTVLPTQPAPEQQPKPGRGPSDAQVWKIRMLCKRIGASPDLYIRELQSVREASGVISRLIEVASRMGV